MDRAQYREYLKSESWQAKRLWAINRAGGRCQLCNSNVGLHVHHRSYARIGREEPGDLTVLCARHHTEFHIRERRFAKRSTSHTVDYALPNYAQNQGERTRPGVAKKRTRLPYGWSAYTPESIGVSTRPAHIVENERDIAACYLASLDPRPRLRCGWCGASVRRRKIEKALQWFRFHHCTTEHLAA